MRLIPFTKGEADLVFMLVDTNLRFIQEVNTYLRRLAASKFGMVLVGLGQRIWLYLALGKLYEDGHSETTRIEAAPLDMRHVLRREKEQLVRKKYLSTLGLTLRNSLRGLTHFGR